MNGINAFASDKNKIIIYKAIIEWFNSDLSLTQNNFYPCKDKHTIIPKNFFFSYP